DTATDTATDSAPDFVPTEALLPSAALAPASRSTFGLLLWAAGALALAGLLWHQQSRFRRRLGQLRRRDVGLWQASTDDIGPVVIGLLRPRIVVPADFDHRYDPQQRELVLAHERVHLRRGDLPMNALACALRCLFWFNPLVHLAAAKLRLDQELACDAVVIARNPRAGRAYATALLNTQLADLGLPVGCAWQSSHPLNWRISMLKKPLPGPARLMLGAGLAVLTSSAAAIVLWQQQPATLITLPAIAVAAVPAAMPPLPAIGPVRVAYAEPVLPGVFAAGAAYPAVAATGAALASDPSVAPPAPPAPPAPASVAPAPPAPPAPSGTPDAPVAPAPPAPPAAVPALAVAPMAADVSRPGQAVPARAPLAVPVPPVFVESPDRIPLPPPPTPRGELSAPAPQLSPVGGANPAAEAADYVPPRVRVAMPARLPRGAKVPPPQVAVVANGEVVRDERVLRPAGREAHVPRDALVADGLVLQVSLDAKGKLVDAKVHENRLGALYERNALAAIKRWRFEPARRAGQAEPSTVLVPVWFEWRDGGFEAMKRDQLSHPKPTFQPAPQPIAGQ
ncbi:MAG: TonB family protein, partial [Arenimonas sp.]|uniref:TonB family protein n=1 Tax=Arenimonas sp. TaxID=1872635 RepID=UPI0025C27E8E